MGKESLWSALQKKFTDSKEDMVQKTDLDFQIDLSVKSACLVKSNILELLIPHHWRL
jgi:hypothetical protein